MSLPKLGFTGAILALAALALFAWLMPLGYLASGLLSVFGAKLVALDEQTDHANGLVAPTFAFLKLGTIAFSVVIMVARHFGVIL